MNNTAPAPSGTSLPSNSGQHTSILTELLSTLNSLQPTKTGEGTNEPGNITLGHPAQSHTPVNSVNSGGQLHHLSPSDTAKARPVFLTLHVLFPHHLLPALDLIDRGLITRFVIPAPTPGQRHDDEDEVRPPSEARIHSPAWEVYYVQSSSAVTGKSNPRRKKQSASATFYEVRLDSWNCSCPAFSVDAFQGLMNLRDGDVEEATKQPEQLDAMSRESEEAGCLFGGTATLPSAGRTPVCKHILAAFLARAAPKLFGSGVAESMASKEQLAGWGGGWGEFGYG